VFGIRRKDLIWLCTTLRTMVDAGLPVSRALDVLAGQARGPMAGVLARVRARVDGGDSLAEAFEAERRFPALFLQLLDAGERSGTLERALAELARFYEFQRDQWHRFLIRISWPVVQYCLAVLVISLALYFLGMIEEKPRSPLPGLLIGYGIPVALIILYRVVLRTLGATRICHELILQLPVVGQVTQRLALMRFSFVMYLMYEAAVPITEALERALKATGNEAFAARAAKAVSTIEREGTLTEALRSTGLFPSEYIDIIEVAEESGKLSERLDWLAGHYAERAEAALSMLATAVTVLVWVSVAAVIIFFIFTFFMRYIGMLYDQM
jgi:type IV pilus assembly protein PilC